MREKSPDFKEDFGARKMSKKKNSALGAHHKTTPIYSRLTNAPTLFTSGSSRGGAFVSHSTEMSVQKDISRVRKVASYFSSSCFGISSICRRRPSLFSTMY